MANIGIGAGFYQSAVLPFSAQRCINLYPVNPQNKGAISNAALFSTPGLDQLFEVDGVGRGSIKFLRNDNLSVRALIPDVYLVAGSKLYQMTNIVANPVELGDIDGTDRVIMATNGFVISIIVPGGKGYFYDPDVGLTEITDPVFQSFQAQPGGVTSVVSLNGVFVYSTSKEFFIGSLSTDNKGKDFPGLEFATAEVKPDDNVRLGVVDNELHVFGTATVQRFRASTTGFLFAPVSGATFDRGLIARHSFVEFDDSFFYLGKQENGGSAILEASRGRISTDTIDSVIQQLSDTELESVYAMSYEEDGALFVCFVLPETTFVYDATASRLQGINIWHERQSNGSQWRVADIIDGFNRKIVTDNESGVIGIMDRDILDEYGDNISREFAGQFIINEGQTFFGDTLELKTQSGVGITPTYPANADQDPVVEMLSSDDGGNTFDSGGTRRLGIKGNFKIRQVWERQGRIDYDRVYKFKTSNKVKVAFLRMDITLAASA
ncbi:hypothetical protein KAR91_82395 [Candidatus Pacearchaeota archaeon]|nr:hypothetical protein [Candidatus Pacearchaeota archaeon]